MPPALFVLFQRTGPPRRAACSRERCLRNSPASPCGSSDLVVAELTMDDCILQRNLTKVATDSLSVCQFCQFCSAVQFSSGLVCSVLFCSVPWSVCPSVSPVSQVSLSWSVLVCPGLSRSCTLSLPSKVTSMSLQVKLRTNTSLFFLREAPCLFQKHVLQLPLAKCSGLSHAQTQLQKQTLKHRTRDAPNQSPLQKPGTRALSQETRPLFQPQHQESRTRYRQTHTQSQHGQGPNKASRAKHSQITADRMDKRNFISTFWGEAFLYACLPRSSSGMTGAEHTSPQKAGFVMCLFEARTRKISRTSKKLETSFHGRTSAEVMFSSSSFITLRYLSIGTKKQTNSDTLPIWKIASRAAAACKIFLQKSPVRQSRRAPDHRERSARATPAPAVPAASLVPVGREEHVVGRP